MMDMGWRYSSIRGGWEGLKAAEFLVQLHSLDSSSLPFCIKTSQNVSWL